MDNADRRYDLHDKIAEIDSLKAQLAIARDALGYAKDQIKAKNDHENGYYYQLYLDVCKALACIDVKPVAVVEVDVYQNSDDSWWADQDLAAENHKGTLVVWGTK